MKQLRIICLLVLPVNISWAEITTDGSVGPASILKGPHFKIGQELGTRAGNNLFHSFGRFNLNRRQSATFTGDSTIKNVISRVTGGQASTINGLLKSEIGNADFYFVNPAGIVFGNNARVDVPAAFHASTAAQLNFADGVHFNALDTGGNQLTIATPDSFGFTSDQTGQITVTTKGLEFKPATKVSLTSQNINIGLATIKGEGVQLQLIANGQQTQDISINALPDNSLQGNIKIVKSAINLSGKGTEQLVIRGGDTLIQESRVFVNNISLGAKEQNSINIQATDLEINDSALTSDAIAEGVAGDIVVTVDNGLSILNGGEISSDTLRLATGDAGNVTVKAGEILIDGQRAAGFTGVSSDADVLSEGRSGAVIVQSEKLLSLVNGGQISATTSFSEGDAGKVIISAEEILIDGKGAKVDTGIFLDTSGSEVLGFDLGPNAGNVDVSSEGALSILNGAVISSSTSGAGDAGDVDISADQILIDGQNSRGFTGVTSNANVGSEGNAGKVNVSSNGLLTVQNGGAISSSTFAKGNAGVVNIDASEILIDRQNANLVTGIFSGASANSKGDAGAVRVSNDGQISLVDGGLISSNTFSTGDAGTIKIDTDTLLIDGRGATIETGVLSDAGLKSEGGSGAVTIVTKGKLSVMDGGVISSRTFAKGDAGKVDIKVGELLIDRQGSQLNTGISSDAKERSTGRAGLVSVTSEGKVSILNGGAISSSTFGGGNAGKVNIDVAELLVDRQNANSVTGIFSDAVVGSKGDAGSVVVTSVGEVSIINGGLISSNTLAAGNAGTVDINTNTLVIDRQSSKFVTGVISDAALGSEGRAGDIAVTTQGKLSVLNGGSISSRTFAAGDAGKVDVRGSEILIDGQGTEFDTGISSDTKTLSKGNAGVVNVRSQGLLTVRNGGTVSSSTFSSGNAGTVNIFAGEVLVNRQNSSVVTGIVSGARSSSAGEGGDIKVVTEGNVSILNGGLISSNTFSTGNAGTVNIKANQLFIDRQNATFETGVFSEAGLRSEGRAGAVSIDTDGELSLINGGVISSRTFAAGDAGRVDIKAGEILIDRQDGAFATGIASDTSVNSQGKAGKVTVVSQGSLSVFRGGGISSSTGSKGDAGSINIIANEILIDAKGSLFPTGFSSNASKGSKGDAGEVSVTSQGDISILNGGVISSSTFAKGNAGKIKITAKKLLIDHQRNRLITGISSSAVPGSTGHAGAILVGVEENLSILNGGSITSSSSSSTGNAGSVNVSAGEILLDGLNSQITSSATGDESGSVGAVVVESGNDITLSNGGAFKITSSSKIDRVRSPIKPRIEVTANQIQLINHGEVSAASTGTLDASNIVINGQRLTLESESRITTSANEGNGGDISLTTNDLVILRDSLVETSVTGSEGNGGDIIVDTSVLFLDTGFIQANTAANRAVGGDISLAIESLIASGNKLISGGNEPVEFVAGSGLNVVQAAAPDGLSGNITNEVPELDVTSALVSIEVPNLNLEKIGQNPCSPSARLNTLKSIGLGGVRSFNKGQQQQTLELLFNNKKLKKDNIKWKVKPPQISSNCQKNPLSNPLTSDLDNHSETSVPAS